MTDTIAVKAGDGHATYITTAIERSHVTRVFYIGILRFVGLGIAVEHDVGQLVHNDTVHIVGKDGLILQVKGAVVVIIRSRIFGLTVIGIHVFGIEFKNVFINHLLAVVAEIHVVGSYVGTKLDFHRRILLLCTHRRTVTSAIDTTMDDGHIFSRPLTPQTDRHLLGIGSELVKGFNGLGLCEGTAT